MGVSSKPSPANTPPSLGFTIITVRATGGFVDAATNKVKSGT